MERACLIHNATIDRAALDLMPNSARLGIHATWHMFSNTSGQQHGAPVVGGQTEEAQMHDQLILEIEAAMKEAELNATFTFCPVVAEVMTELTIDNCPGVVWLEEVV